MKTYIIEVVRDVKSSQVVERYELEADSETVEHLYQINGLELAITEHLGIMNCDDSIINMYEKCIKEVEAADVQYYDDVEQDAFEDEQRQQYEDDEDWDEFGRQIW
jgi:hypothetical protein